MEGLNQKNTFKVLFLTLVLVLMVLPFVTIFNNVLTKWFEAIEAYRLLQSFIVPFESKVVGVILIPLGFHYVAFTNGMQVNGHGIILSWNCLGWQSLLLFFVTAVSALSGNFTLFSKLQACFMGIIGMFLVNIFRIAIAAVLMVTFDPVFVTAFHNYLASFMSVLFLLFFWWFAYIYILEEKSQRG